jgi:hypothetical protein
LEVVYDWGRRSYAQVTRVCCCYCLGFSEVKAAWNA